jgi:hypothetical protein
VEGLSQIPVKNVGEVMRVIGDGIQNRATSGTLMVRYCPCSTFFALTTCVVLLQNKASSRSHVLLLISVEQRSRAQRDRTVRRGTLTIVDLAGSERVSKSGSEGQRLEEVCTRSISQSVVF